MRNIINPRLLELSKEANRRTNEITSITHFSRYVDMSADMVVVFTSGRNAGALTKSDFLKEYDTKQAKHTNSESVTWTDDNRVKKMEHIITPKVGLNQQVRSCKVTELIYL